MDETTLSQVISVRGARVHNLRNLDVDIPRDKLVVLTGVSGSGKSSLAFDTIHAEGQRRYIEGLSSFARLFLDQLEPPDVDSIAGLPPTVAIDQKTGQASPRSTVGTLTEIHDYLRLLYARIGLPHCPKCGQAIRRQTPEEMVQGVMALGEGKKVIVLAPLVRGRKGTHAEVFATIRREGLIRARVDGELVEIGDAPPKLAKTKTHTIEAVMDRLVVREGMRVRLAESLDRALKIGEGTVILSEANETGGWTDRVLSVNFACPDCGIGLERVEPRTFSFNSPYGACPTCTGLGTVGDFDFDLILPNRAKTLDEEAVVVPDFPGGIMALKVLANNLKVDDTTAVETWSEVSCTSFLHGVSKILTDEIHASPSERRKAKLEAFQVAVTCPSCRGARLRPEALAVKLGGLSIHEVSILPGKECVEYFSNLAFDPLAEIVGKPLVGEIVERLGFLRRVGLDYLSLDRPAPTLSGGELQRVRLAAQIGSGLVGVCYVLDEPTSGLHPRDTMMLIESFRRLRDSGNTVLVVEHDDQVIRSADWIVDIGPGAGPDGGTLLVQGPPEGLSESSNSITARFLNAAPSRPNGRTARLDRSPGAIKVIGASEQNLRSISTSFPLGCLTCVTGVSGSGKSTLAQNILARAARRYLGFGGPSPGRHSSLTGLEAITSFVDINQTPIGRSPRSTPATFIGVFDEIRSLFAKMREAKIRGYKSARFSFNAKGGRCERCEGLGSRKIAMQFLADLYVRCEFCRGLRYNRPTLEVRYRGHSIGEILQMRVDEALIFFDAIPKVRRGIAALHDAGLGYVTLGQSATTLSGGESQRVKLAAGLNRIETGGALYVLDEPTTGLHASDVANLLRVLNRLADLGNTLVVIEHNVEVIRAADWVIDLGPGGGPNGGILVASGTPAELAQNTASMTGAYLG